MSFLYACSLYILIAGDMSGFGYDIANNPKLFSELKDDRFGLGDGSIPIVRSQSLGGSVEK